MFAEVYHHYEGERCTKIQAKKINEKKNNFLVAN